MGRDLDEKQNKITRYNLSRAIYHLDFLSKKSSSKNINYGKAVVILVIVMFYLFTNAPFAFHLINNIIYFLQNIFKTLLFVSATNTDHTMSSYQIVIPDLIRNPRRHTKSCIERGMTSDTEYPIYTILLPVYKEANIAHMLIKAINQIDYPKSKLDVKIAVEADDLLTIKALAAIDLPEYMSVIKIPYSQPRTKPKALNYAMRYAKGEYLVIYDAEDRPASDQLLKALELFAKLPEDYVCLQAKLNFYNRDETLLTKLFSLEYSLWFDFLLNGLGNLSLPITLGGTSNHFKISALRAVGSWDSHNVTEDADLGIRLYLRGFKTAILDSYTMEESPISLGSWLAQRARWIKGFTQTFIVYLKHFMTLLRERRDMPKHDHVTIFIFVGFGTYSFLILPWLIVTTSFLHSKFLTYTVAVNTVFALSYMYGVALLILRRSRRGYFDFTAQDILAFCLWPLYFALHTIASYRAVFELLTKPFEWNKTEHGVSVL